jgi:hypothetical protein
MIAFLMVAIGLLIGTNNPIVYKLLNIIKWTGIFYIVLLILILFIAGTINLIKDKIKR